MVDKENRWDDIEYTDDQNIEDFDDFDASDFNEGKSAGSAESGPDEQNYEEQEYSEQDYDDDYEDDEDYDDASHSDSGAKKKNLFPLLILVLLLLGLLAYFFISKQSNNAAQDTVDNNTVNIEQPADDSVSFEGGVSGEEQFFSEDSTDMVAVNFDENTASSADGTAAVNNTAPADQVTGSETISFGDSAEPSVSNAGSDADLFMQSETPVDKNTSNENNDIIISYDKVARLNPFKPPVSDADKAKNLAKSSLALNNTGFEIVEPPVSSVPDENLTRLLQTQVSGILYDEESPSAIVSLNGVDTFVKEGDSISGYKIQTITREKVQINYKNNSYVASVGALFVRGMLESRPAVANLEKKFAGRYKDEQKEQQEEQQEEEKKLEE